MAVLASSLLLLHAGSSRSNGGGGSPPSPGPTASPTPTPTTTASPTQSPIPTWSSTPTPSPSPSITPTLTPTLSASATPTPSASATVTPTPNASGTATPTPTPSPTAAFPIWMWGSNAAGQFGIGTVAAGLPAQVVRYYPEWTQYTAASSGFSAWLKFDGTLWLSGGNSYGQLAQNDITNRSSLVQEITNSTWSLLGSSAGASAFAVKATDNKLYAWGENDHGKLGIDLTGNRLTPVEVVGSVTNWKQIVSSDGNTYGLTLDGNAWGWGNNNVGQLNSASALLEASSPVQIVNDKSFASIQSGSDNFIGLVDTGSGYTLWTCGYNAYGQQSTGNTVNQSSILQLGAAGEWAKVSCRADHVVGLKNDGSVWTWGRNNAGQCGTGTTVQVNSMVQVGSNCIDVNTGYRATYIMKSDRSVWAVGNETNFNIGTPSATNKSSFVQAVVGTNWLDTQAVFEQFGNDLRGGFAKYLNVQATPTPTTTASPTPTPSPSAASALYGWGINAGGTLGLGNVTVYSQPVQIALQQYASAARAGNISSAHACYLKPSGALFGAGSNGTGALGINTITDSLSPVQEISASTWLRAAVFRSGTIAQKNDGTLWSWGGNVTYGTLGDGTKINKSSPVAVLSSTTNWQSISCGYFTNAAITDTNELWIWGGGGSGILGISSLANRSSMVQIAGTNWSTISFGNDFALARKTDGTAWSWGNNTSGQLGTNNVILISSPVQIGTDNNWTQLSAGGAFGFGLKSDNTLWSWGSPANFQNAQGQDTVWTSSPTQIAGSWLAVQAMETCVYAIDTNNRIFAAGAGTSGQLGLNNASDTSLLQQIPGLEYIEFAAVGAQGRTGMIFARPVVTPTPTPSPTENILPTPLPSQTVPPAQQALFGWASNNFSSMLMNGTTTATISPPVILRYNPEWVSQVKSGTTTAAGQALKFDGSLWMAGSASAGQLAGPSVATSSMVIVGTTNEWATSIPVGASTNTFFGIKQATGKLWAWGDGTNRLIGDGVAVDRSSPVQVATTVNNWAAIVPSSTHVLGLQATGDIWAWGTNTNGQFGDNTVIGKSTPTQIGVLGTNFAQVAAGTSFSAGVKKDGSLWTWGLNTSGQLGLSVVTQKNSPVQVGLGTDWSKVLTGAAFTAGLKKDGTLWAWGANASGQLAQNNVINRSSPVQVSAPAGRTWIDLKLSNANMFAIDSSGGLWSAGALLGMPEGTAAASSMTQSSGLSGYQCVSFPQALGSLAQGTMVWAIPAAATPTPTLSPTTTASPTPSPSASPEPTPTLSPEPTASPTPSPSESPTPTPSPSPTTLIDLYAWGSGLNGQLGLNETITRFTPTFQSQSSEYVGVNPPYSVAGSNAGIVKADGTAWVWGNNTSGSLGLNNVINYSSPVQLGTENNWSQILIGNTNSLAIKKDGTLWGWGSNGSSALGNIISIFDTISSPMQLVTETGWTNIGQAPSNIGTTLVKNDGTLWLSGNFGSALQVSYSSFTQYGTDTNWKIVTNWGGANFLAFKTDGTMWSTGTNSSGQLGLGDIINRSSWTQIGTANNWVEGTMQNSVCALNTLNELWVWGFNSAGQLGQSDTIGRSSPVQIAGSWRTARVRGQVTIGVKTDGTLWGCGLGGTGMLGTGNDTFNKSSMVQTVIADNYWIDLDCVQSGVFAFRQANVPTPTVTLSPTPSPSLSPEPTSTPSPTPSESLTPSPTESPTSTPTPSPSESPTPTPSPSATCTPVPLPVTSGMVGWFDASDTSKINGGTPTNGVQVSSWGNSTTNATWAAMQQATSLKQPTWFSDGTVAGSYVLFDNTAGANSDGMTTNGAYSLSGACTIVVMEDCFASISPSHRTVQSSSINALISLNQYGGGTPIGCFYGASIVSGYQSGTGKHNGIMTKSAANAIKYYVDGTNRTSGSPTSASNWAQVCFGGAGANPNEPANTKLLEVIVYDRELSAAEVTQVSDYLQCKWTNPGPTPQPTIGPATASPTPSPSAAPATATPTPSPSASETPSPTPSASETPATPTPSPTIGTVSAWWGWGQNTSGALSIGNVNQVTGLYNPQASDFTQICIGTAFFGLKADNTLWVCGSNASANLGLGDVISRSSMVQATGSWIRAIGNVNLSSGIKTDGTLWTWGSAGQGSAAINTASMNASTPVQEILGKTDWVTHFVGTASQLAVDKSGKLWTVGSDSSGNQGLNTINVNKSTFTQIGAGTDWSSTFVSNAFSAALKTNGSVYVWGLNTVGQLGDGTVINKSSPVQVVPDKTISKIVGSSGGIILLDTSGNLWGTGQQQLGLNDITPRSSYTQVASGVLDACANGSNILFIKTDNTLWGVGAGGSALLNASLVNVSSPIMLDNTFSWQYFNSIRGTFQNQTFAYANGLPQATPTVTASPTPTPTPSPTPEVLNWWGWGAGTNGQMGNDRTTNLNALNNFYPASVYADVAIGNNGLFKKTDGTLWQAGLNSYGRLGINSTINASSQIQITGANFASFGIANVQTRVFPNGTLWSAGQGANGGLANSAVVNQSSPVQESLGKTDWVESFSFSNCQIALDSSGRLWSCGFNGQGQCGQNDLINRSQFVQIGAATNWVDVTVSTVNFIAKKNDNTYWTCGVNTSGQFGLNNVINASSPIQIGSTYTIQKITGGSTITFILDNVGNIWGTGANGSGTIGDGTSISKSSWVQMLGGPWIDVKPCATAVFMIKSDNTLWAVGAINANLSLGTFANAQSSPVMIDNTKTWLRFSEQPPGSNSMSAQGVQAGFPTPTPT